MKPVPEGLIYDWNRDEAEGAAPPPDHIDLDDETLRDGLQNPSVVSPPLEEKVRFLHLISDLGITGVSIGLPAAGSKAEEETLRLAKEIQDSKLPLFPNCAARTVVKDVEAVLRISDRSGLKVEAAIFLGSSPIRHQVEQWDLDFLLRKIEESVGLARRAGVPVMFVTEDTTRSRPEILEALYSKALDVGATRLCIADTVGAADRRGTDRVVRFLKKLTRDRGFDDVDVDWHGHRDRGLGLANSLTALDAGADRVHGAGLGIGERIGNTPIDLLIVNLKLRGWWKRDVRRLTEYVDWTSVNLNVPIPDDYPVFGKNAFRTQAGVHASAILKAMKHGEPELASKVYSSIDASWFGFEQIIDVGPMSGTSNVQFWLMRHGLEESPGLVEAILDKAKKSSCILSDMEILQLVREREDAS